MAKPGRRNAPRRRPCGACHRTRVDAGGPAAKFMRSVSHTGGGRVARAIDAFNRRIAAVGSRKPPRLGQVDRGKSGGAGDVVAYRRRGTDTRHAVGCAGRQQEANSSRRDFARSLCVALDLLPRNRILSSADMSALRCRCSTSHSCFLIIFVLHRVRWNAWDASFGRLPHGRRSASRSDRLVAIRADRAQGLGRSAYSALRRARISAHPPDCGVGAGVATAAICASGCRRCRPSVFQTGVEHWIGSSGAKSVRASSATRTRRREAAKTPTSGWSSRSGFPFGIAFAMAIWLAVHATHEAARLHIFEKLADQRLGWPMAVGLFIVRNRFALDCRLRAL